MVTVMECNMADNMAKAREARLKARTSEKTSENPTQNRLSRLDPARRSSVERRLSQMPKLYRGAYLLAVGGRSPRAGIKAFCAECTGWQRGEAGRCTALACPLYAYRPGREA